MSDVRALSGTPVLAQFGGAATPTPSSPLMVDTATGKLYVLTAGDIVSLIADGIRAAIATDATTGFTYLPSCAGTPTGAPAGTPTGAFPFIYDSTANKLWVYNGSWRGIAVA